LNRQVKEKCGINGLHEQYHHRIPMNLLTVLTLSLSPLTKLLAGYLTPLCLKAMTNAMQMQPDLSKKPRVGV
jgi:hypothetical protein